MSHFTLGYHSFFSLSLSIIYFIFFLFLLLVLKQAQVAQAVLESVMYLETLNVWSSCFYLPNTWITGVPGAWFSQC